MTPAETIRILKKIKPKTRKDLDGRLKYRYLGSGCYRAAFLLLDSDIVIKFPIKGKHHSRREILVVRKILRNRCLKHLVRYIPKIHYMDFQNGVIALERLKRTGRDVSAVCNVLEKMFEDSLSSHSTDIHRWNVGQDRKGDLKIFDFGLVL